MELLISVRINIKPISFSTKNHIREQNIKHFPLINIMQGDFDVTLLIIILSVIA